LIGVGTGLLLGTIQWKILEDRLSRWWILINSTIGPVVALGTVWLFIWGHPGQWWLWHWFRDSGWVWLWNPDYSHMMYLTIGGIHSIVTAVILFYTFSKYASEVASP
jgi:hypothetical protein